MSMVPFLQGAWQASIEAVFPPKCFVCSAYYNWRRPAAHSASPRLSDVIAPYVCESCRVGFAPIVSPSCLKCGLPFRSRQGEDHTCSECLQEARYFRKARAFGVYEGHLMEAIHRLKYGKKAYLCQLLGALVREAFFQFWDAKSIDVVMPVPLHIKRLRERGFNQACLVVSRWAKPAGISFDGRTLSRGRWTDPQTNLAGKERRKNVKGAFSVRRPEKVRERRILLVDDVFTTGATVNECARVLMKAGAEFVDVLTLARAV